jgi:hypothetical protein
MFRSYAYGSYGPPRKPHSFIIIDDDFEEQVDTEAFFFEVLVAVYERRGLLVTPNLFRAVMYWRDCYAASPSFKEWSLGELIQRLLTEWNELDQKYVDDLMHYLVLG